MLNILITNAKRLMTKTSLILNRTFRLIDTDFQLKVNYQNTKLLNEKINSKSISHKSTCGIIILPHAEVSESALYVILFADEG